MRNREGFTLIEVVLAMAIVSFAFILVLGLIPLGLKTAQKAASLNMEAQIAQKLSNQMQLLYRSGNIDGALDRYYYFDEMGREIKEGREPSAVFAVRSSGTEKKRLPGSVVPNESIRTIRFSIEKVIDKKFTNYFSVIVVDENS